MAYTPGPKELGLRKFKAERIERGKRVETPKPNPTELRSKVAKIKGKPRKAGGKRGR